MGTPAFLHWRLCLGTLACESNTDVLLWGTLVSVNGLIPDFRSRSTLSKISRVFYI